MLKAHHFLLLICLSISFAPASYGEDTKGKISGGKSYTMPDWFKESFLDLGDDAEEAAESGKQLLVFFHLKNCPYCANTLDENFREGKTKDYIEKHFDVVDISIRGGRDVNLDDFSGTEQEFARKLGVAATPAILFLNGEGEVVNRLDGYRSPKVFAKVMAYVAEKQYKKQSLANYMAEKSKVKYDFIKHDLFTQSNDLSGQKGPVGILFESKHCIDCADFHKRILNDKEVKEEIKKYQFVRIDAESGASFTGIDGKKTSMKDFAKNYGINYYPSVILFNEGKLQRKESGQLYRYHFKEVLRYVSGKHYKTLGRFGAYLRSRGKELTDEGIDINMGKDG